MNRKTNRQNKTRDEKKVQKAKDEVLERYPDLIAGFMRKTPTERLVAGWHMITLGFQMLPGTSELPELIGKAARAKFIAPNLFEFRN